MVVKGYYASICHGLTFIGALANMVVGAGLMGIGLFLAFDFIAAPYGLGTVGFVLVGAGCLTMLNGVLAMYAGCKERLSLIRTTMYLSILQITVLLVVVVIVMTGTKKPDQLRLDWAKIPDAQRLKIENHLQCCGYDGTEDGTEGCNFKKSCGEFIPPTYITRKTPAVGGGAIGLMAGALSLFASYCLQRKMRKQEGRANKKAFTSLQDQSRGVDRNTRPKRPPRSERTPHRGHDAV